MLLMIGYLTTPTSSTGVSLSEFWAWVRYLSAVTPDPDLRLTSSFADLDAHQKTILSDDFGMGAPLLWLNEHLDLDRIVDGRYFVEYVAASMGATQRRTAKRGPNKSPDFVARDTSGVWHVIECKGTQSGREYGARQLGNAGPPPTGGVAQKRSILFPAGYTGQRLVSGLQIGVEAGNPSHLTFIDPEPEKPFVVSEQDLELANDAATRCVMSKALRLSGYETSAEVTASPFGRRPSERYGYSKKLEEQRVQEVNDRNERARDELKNRERTSLFGEHFLGREQHFALPRSVIVDDTPVSRVVVRQGLNEDAIKEMQDRPTIEETISESGAEWEAKIGRSMLKSEERSATMTIGSVFRSEMILEK
ncbi:hypothetical protein [Leisingera methylohalidivorans]|nr:hypothetical protein [Leisingera methylohalidivorans]